MAALFLHNALFIPEPQDHQQQRSSVHSRTMSTGTLRTVATNASQPNEPLLTPESNIYTDMLNRQPAYPSSVTSTWQHPLSLEGDPTTYDERKGFWERRIRRRLRVLKWIKLSIETVMAIWCIYNTVRYFLAFTIYEVMDGQSVSLVLGSATALGFALYACAGILVACHPYLVAQHTPIRSLIITRTIFRTIASFLVLVPAIVNFVLVFVWRNSSKPQIGVNEKCSVDIDVIWSVTRDDCPTGGPSWVTWLVIAICRLLLTAVFLALQYISASAYHATRRPSLSRSRRRRRHEFGSGDSTLASPPMTTRSSAFPITISSSATVIPFPSTSHLSRPHSLHSKKDVQGLTPDRRSLKSSQSKSRPGSSGSTGAAPISAPASPRASRVIEEEEEEDEEDEEEDATEESSSSEETGPSSSVEHHHHHHHDHPPVSVSPGSSAHHSSSSLSHGLNVNPITSLEEERELHRFANQFRSLVTQITREVEDAIEFSMGPVPIPATYIPRSESPASMTEEGSIESSSAEFDADSYTRLPRYTRTHISYNEFGIPYSAQSFDRVRIVNGYVRRMPTIESLGSREVHGSVASSSQASPIIDNGAHDRIPSIHSLSRPPTRTNTLDTASDPPTRANSLKERRASGSGRVNQVVEATELGELITEKIQKEQKSCSSMGTSSTGSGTVASYGTASGSSGMGGSTHSVRSYHTASSDSASPRSAGSGYGQEFLLQNLEEHAEGSEEGHDITENSALAEEEEEDAEDVQSPGSMSGCHLA